MGVIVLNGSTCFPLAGAPTINRQGNIMTPAIKKTAPTKKAAKKKVTGKKAVIAKKTPMRKVAKKPTKTSEQDISPITIAPEERWRMIAVAAYHKAEKRGFAPGNELRDWAEAEKEIDKLIFG
jgi:hypothetical protein